MLTIRVILVHQINAFRHSLIDILTAEGYEVTAFDDAAYVVPAPTASDHLTITITESWGAHPGLRLRVTGLPRGEPYAGVLGGFLAHPVREADAVKSLRRFRI